MIKPDGVQRGLVGEIIKRFETKGYKLVAMKLVQVSKVSLLISRATRFAASFTRTRSFHMPFNSASAQLVSII